MAKKTLSIVLAVIMLMSVLVVGSFAAESSEMKVKKLLLGSYVNGGVPLTDAKYNEYVSLDPTCVEDNLFFWDDEIIDAYNNAKTEADWAALYEEMTGEDKWVRAYEGDDGYLIDYYPLHLCNGKGKTVIDYATDVNYAKPGDVITVTVSVTTNFSCRDCEVGIIYDKTLMEYVADSGAVVPSSGRKLVSVNPNYGIYKGTNKDDRINLWPDSMRENKNGEYDQYGMIKVNTSYDREYANFTYGVHFDHTPIATAQFKVKDGVADGTELKFFSVDGTQPILADFERQESTGVTATLFKTYRILGDHISVKPIECSEYDQTYTFNNATVMVGEPAPDLADYVALDAAITDFDDAAAADYKADLWAAYANAVDDGTNLSRELPATEQATVDAAKDAIVNAKAALLKNEVVSAAQNGTADIGQNATVNVTVDGSPANIRLVGDSTLTFTRDDATIVANNDGTETWTIDVLAASDSADYEVYAKYANWTVDGKTLTITAGNALDLGVYSIYVDDMVYPEGNGGVVTKGKHKVTVVTGKDVYKIQFVDTTGRIEDGCTSTYCPQGGGHFANVEPDGDKLVWTFEFAFTTYGDWSMPLRTRAITTTFSTVENVTLDAYVIY